MAHPDVMPYEDSEEIDLYLETHRPERYSDNIWMTPLIEKKVDDAFRSGDIRNLMFKYFSTRVGQREKGKVKRGNDALRSIAREGGVSPEFLASLNVPITIEVEIQRDGKVERFNEKVKLGDATPNDLINWAKTERRRADVDHAARIESAEGAEIVAAGTSKGGFRNAGEWAEASK